MQPRIFQVPKGFIIIAFIILVPIQTSGQDVRVDRTHSIKATYLGLTYAYEQPVSKRSILNIELGLSSGFGYVWTSADYWGIYPSFRLEPRLYYNYLKRKSVNKKTTNNSANYIALSFDYHPAFGIGKDLENIQSAALIPKVGLRRSVLDKLFFEFATGYGPGKSEEKDWIGVLAFDLKIGFILKK